MSYDRLLTGRVGLESVMQAQLYLARRRAHAADLTEVGVRHTVVRISVAGNVENVKEIRSETDYVTF